ncbi:MAG: VWA domain-containing protein [Burkholderiales bacterium]|nr:MAG: VWA domain-containing protein [Burkholderiales bacterium]
MPPAPLAAVGGFAAHLREHGFRVGVAEQRAMLEAALAVPVAEYARLQACWRAIACTDATEWRRYPSLFTEYWFPEAVRGGVKTSGATRPRRDLRQLVEAMRADMGGADRPGGPADTGLGQAGETGEGDERSGYARGGASRAEPLEQRAFGQWLPQDLRQLERIVEAVARRMRKRLSRRMRPDPLGQALDLRRTLRASLRTGGIPFQPVWRKRRTERPRVFILVDVSRSMQTYAQLFLRVARAFVGVLDARVFVFHTRLIEVTALLERDSARVQEKVNAVTAGFGAGTRIATSFAQFVGTYARGRLGRSTRVLVMSDGFDSDPPQALGEQLRPIRRRGARVFWLHPSREAPQSGALAPARELITAFAPVHNVESLARIDRLID